MSDEGGHNKDLRQTEGLNTHEGIRGTGHSWGTQVNRIKPLRQGEAKLNETHLKEAK